MYFNHRGKERLQVDPRLSVQPYQFKILFEGERNYYSLLSDFQY